jgi:4-methyl-5(b-hydroxyethyl)-thiazole monophosphate biosynthesis
MASVLVPIANGFEEIEAVSIIDVLRRGGIEVVTASVDRGESQVTGANGITIITNNELKYVDADEFDMVVLPGGHDNAMRLRDSEEVQKILKDFDSKGKKIAAICAAPVALEKAGVIKDRYTCYPSYEEQIGVEKFTDSQNVVVDQNIITSRGPATAICFGLEIVRELVGEDTYKEIKRGLLADFC